MNVRSVLVIPSVYRIFTKIIGGSRARVSFVRQHVKPKENDKVLDIGCGPGSILEFLPMVDYVGFDSNSAYIEAAKKRFAGRAQFMCRNVSRDAITGSSFDLVLALGILHHLKDDEASQLLELAHNALRTGGRLVTLDGCYVKNQSKLARYLLSKDRGQFVRQADAYVTLARNVFSNIKVTIRHDLILPIPYTHIIMECTK